MISIFPTVNSDEHLFSILGRYQSYQSESSPRDILKDLFGKGSLRATMEFPTHLEALSKSLNHLEKSKEEYLKAHTIFPLYEPFMTSDEADILKKMMYEDGGYRVKFKIGYIAGSILKKESLYYCPECLKHDLEEGIEPYFRTVHQMQGVQVCSEHNVMLMLYPISRENMSVIRYYHLDINLIGSIECEGNKNRHLLSIAKAFDDIRSGILEGIDLDVIKKVYRDRLHELGFMSVNGSVVTGKIK